MANMGCEFSFKEKRFVFILHFDLLFSTTIILLKIITSTFVFLNWLHDHSLNNQQKSCILKFLQKEVSKLDSKSKDSFSTNQTPLFSIIPFNHKHVPVHFKLIYSCMLVFKLLNFIY